MGRCPTLSEKKKKKKLVRDGKEEISSLSHKHSVSIVCAHLWALCGGVVPQVFVVLFKDYRGEFG